MSRYTVLAEDNNGRLLGFVCAFGGKDSLRGTLVDNLHVAKDSEGKGIGRTLMGAAAAWAHREFPDVGFYLSAIEGNTRARQFYEHIGGRTEGVETSVMPDGTPVPAVVYMWPVVDPLLTFAPGVE